MDRSGHFRMPATVSLGATMHRVSRRKVTGALASRFRKLNRAVVESLEERRLLATGVIINEFMASNSTGYQDPAFPGQHPDWIELYNPTASAVSLSGWQLKDGSAQAAWVFPAGASIPASGFLVVAADGKNLKDPAKVMHTDFNLDKNGEYLGLLK